MADRFSKHSMMVSLFPAVDAPPAVHSDRIQPQIFGADRMGRKWETEPIADDATGTHHRALDVALGDLPCVKFTPERIRRLVQATGTLAKIDRIDSRLLARIVVALGRTPLRNQRTELVNTGT